MSLFFLKFTKLNSLLLGDVNFNSGIMSILFMFPSLELISIYDCDLTSDHLSEIFNSCTSLKEMHLSSNIGDETLMKLNLPPQLEIFELIHHNSPIELNLTLSTKLESLSIDFFFDLDIFPCQVPSLRKLYINGNLDSKISENSFPNLEKLDITLEGCCRAFGSSTDNFKNNFHFDFLTFQCLRKVKYFSSGPKNISFAFSSGNRSVAVIHHWLKNDMCRCVDNSRYNLRQGPIMVKYSPLGHQPTITKLMPSQ